MDFFVDIVDGMKVLRMDIERLDSTHAPELKAQFLVLITETDNRLVVDMRKVIHADSSGLGALLLGARQARDKRGAIALWGLQPRVASLIRIAHLNNVLVSFSTLEEALASFKQA